MKIIAYSHKDDSDLPCRLGLDLEEMGGHQKGNSRCFVARPSCYKRRRVEPTQRQPITAQNAVDTRK